MHWTVPTDVAVGQHGRILILGSNGAGKSTFARKLGALIDREVIHLDAIYYQAGWKALPRDRFVDSQRSAVSRERWIMDGNYLSTFDVRSPRAQMVIVFDLPWWICLRRVIVRSIVSGRRPRPDMNPECVDWMSWLYLRFLWRVVTFRRKVMPRLERNLRSLPRDAVVVWLRSDRKASEFLRQVGGASA